MRTRFQVLGAIAALLAAAALPAAAQTRTVSVTPDTLQLAVGDTARPRVAVRAGNGAAVPGAALTFSSSNATVFTAHRDGAITARAPGCATWRVSHDTYARAQVAVCVVAAAPAPTPDPVPVPVDTVRTPVPTPTPTPSSFTPNLPAGLTRITDTYFGNLRTDGFNADGLAYAWSGRNATDASAPFGPAVFETYYPGNHRGNGEGGASLFGREGQAWRQMYFALMQWVPADYSMHTNGEKFFYPIVTTGGRQTSSLMLGWHTPEWAGYPGGASDSTFVFGLQTQLGDPNRFQARTAPRLVKGRWQRVEAHFVMNTPGRRDGTLRVWIDGALAIDWRDAYFSAQSAQSAFDGIRFEGVRGGGASSALTPPHGQVRRYSRLAFYAAP